MTRRGDQVDRNDASMRASNASVSSRITTTCDVCGWSETIPVGLVGDAAETVTALWRRHDAERPTCPAHTGTVSLDTDLGGDR